MRTFKVTANLVLGILPQTITIVVPAAAGGPSDTVARLIADKMSAEFGQQVLIENMGGAGGSLGAARVAKADPDGYTLLLYHVGVSTFGALYPNLPYDTTTAFSSVGLVTDVPMTLVSRKDLDVADVVGLMDWLKADGDGATFGTAGVGSVSDLCGRQLSEANGIEFTVVPYKGTGPAMTDLLGGQIDLMCDQTTNTANQIKAGEIKPYAVTTPERIALLPDTPTLAQSGLGVVFRGQRGNLSGGDLCPAPDDDRAEIWCGRVFQPDGHGPCDVCGAGARLGDEGAGHGGVGLASRHGRHRRLYRHTALHLRHEPIRGRSELRGRGRWRLRHRRDPA